MAETALKGCAKPFRHPNNCTFIQKINAMKSKQTILFSLLVLFASSAFAQQAQLVAQRNQLLSDLKAFKVVKVDNKEQLVETNSVMPGDIIEYQLTYINETGGSISNLRPVLPVPDGMIFIEETANPTLHAVSITNDQVFQQPPVLKEIVLPNGSKGKIKVDPKEYRFLQWLQDSMNSGEIKTFKARMRIIAPQVN